MKMVTRKRLDYIKKYGYTVKILSKHFALVRVWSKNCTSSFFKRYLSPYCLVMIIEDESNAKHGQALDWSEEE